MCTFGGTRGKSNYDVVMCPPTAMGKEHTLCAPKRVHCIASHGSQHKMAARSSRVQGVCCRKMRRSETGRGAAPWQGGVKKTPEAPAMKPCLLRHATRPPAAPPGHCRPLTTLPTKPLISSPPPAHLLCRELPQTAAKKGSPIPARHQATWCAPHPGGPNHLLWCVLFLASRRAASPPAVLPRLLQPAAKPPAVPRATPHSCQGGNAYSTPPLSHLL